MGIADQSVGASSAGFLNGEFQAGLTGVLGKPCRLIRL
ncbi:hypothetical protein PLANPX_2009 [Lacipirellula parvula]|uniref:Uncharacterized protein n=1 Tax=Lacipirellula parvula TaxID=2650471 RepID=A0A5K7X938_9BACT|nr:hypothetical protein PLANPX_2009 [Lacipirellula parvula]